MKREIKFRGKPCYKGVKTWPWVYGTFQYIAQRRVNPGATDNGRLEPRVDKGRIVDLYGNKTEVLYDTVGQFSGLYDKNGTPIYEGDIVDAWSAGQHTTHGVIRYVPPRFFIGLYNKKRKEFYDSWHLSPNAFGKDELLEVIGNIHDNPELLK